MITEYEQRSECTRVLFMRHGQAHSDPTIYDADDNRSLTASGWKAVADISTQIALFSPQRLFCSNSLRAYQTAHIIAEKVGLVPEQATGLNERVFHCLEGLTREQIANRFGINIVNAVEHCSDKIELPGEETLMQARQRICSTLFHILNGAHKRLAIVSHGGPHSWLLAAELGLNVMKSRVFRLDEASFSVLEFTRTSSDFQLNQILALNTRLLPMNLEYHV
jgi:broad specificity phosphatase PhoE